MIFLNQPLVSNHPSIDIEVVNICKGEDSSSVDTIPTDLSFDRTINQVQDNQPSPNNATHLTMLEVLIDLTMPLIVSMPHVFL